MNIHWYPGHMTKAKRMMDENIKLVDMVIEIIDARAPLSSRNPDIDSLAKNKYRLILMNKSDMADEKENAKWVKFFEDKGIKCIPVNCRNAQTIKNLDKTIKDVCKEKIERDRKRGILKRSIKIMVAGIPNVGKSTFINAISKKSSAKTGNKPGVTKGKQWISYKGEFEFLDTPGLLWPKFDDVSTGIILALIGSVNDEILDICALSYKLIEILKVNYPGLIKEKFEIDESMEAPMILEEYTKKRNLIKAKGEIDIQRGAKLIIDDFRNVRIARITLEKPENEPIALT
ncbi:MAG: ribosome biogenesis GTPase YlqF [Lachnospiraceae bacterium]|nr:ribosome biogenesis GTPase YlqF [Lachnospiraceae bacterium]